MPDNVFTAEELARLPQRARLAGFQPAVLRLRREAEAYYAKNLTVPELPGGYYHDFTCPEHGVEMRFDPHRPGEHRCPVDEARFEGEKYDAAWRWFVNHDLAEGALRLAVLWRIDGAEKHRETVRQTLLGYADRYGFYATCSHNDRNPGVATYTTLDESVWAIPLAWAYSLMADTLSAAEQSTITAKLFVPAAEHLVSRRYGGIHNFTCWHNAAISTLGRVSGRADLVRFALEGATGQRAQLAEGMLADGLWFEGSMSYHFYSTWALLMSALVFRHDGATEITTDPALPRSLRAPLTCAYPDGTLPATNDCWYSTGTLGPCCHGVPPAPDFFEIAFSLYRDPAFADALNRAYRHGSRGSVYALLFGAEALPPVATPARRSVDLPESGLAILRPSETVDVMLKYGPHGGHHGHPDKLGLTGWAHGWRFSSDLGTPGYGVASLETWYRQTLSHNTVLIDGESQPSAHGRLEHFDPGTAVVAVEWDGVRLRRAVHARPEYFIDVFEVNCAAPRLIDWIYHNAGALKSEAGAAAVPVVPAGGTAFQHLGAVRQRAPDADAPLEWRDESFALRLWMPRQTGEEVFTGHAPGNPPTQRRGFLLRRTKDERTTFLSVFHPYHGTPRVSGVEFSADGGLIVHVATHADRWTPAQLAHRRG